MKTNVNFSKILNIYHKTNYSKKSWSILLYPWLYHYQSTLYDRWKTFLNNKEKKRYVFKEKDLSFKCGNDFSSLSQNNNWNNYIYSKIQKFHNQSFDKNFSLKNISKKKNSNIFIFIFFIFKPLKYFLNSSKPFVVDSPNFSSVNIKKKCI